MNPMSNDEALAAFQEYLQSTLCMRGIDTTSMQQRALQAVREFAAAIYPVPLSEATVQEMRIFERTDAAKRAVGMSHFRVFRDTVLRPVRRKGRYKIHKWSGRAE